MTLFRNALVLTALLTVPASAQQPAEDYPSYLYSRGFFTEARSAYLHQSWSAKDESSRVCALFWASKSMLESGNFAKAELELYDLSRRAGVDPAVKEAAAFEYLRAQYFQKRYSVITESVGQEKLPVRTQVLMFWALIGDGEWQSAETLAADITQRGGLGESEQRSFSAAADLVRTRPEFNTVSPLLAASLSAAIPGAGHAYAGSWTNAFGSFLLNSVFIALTAYSVHERNYLAAGVCGFLEIGWYAGNIASAYQTAAFANIAAERRYKTRIGNSFPFPIGYTYRF